MLATSVGLLRPRRARGAASSPRPCWRVAALCAAALCAAACATPVGVRQVDPRSVYRDLGRNALSDGVPSAASQQVLERLDLARYHAGDPEGALRAIHAGLGDETTSDRLFALAELSFLHAESSGGSRWYLASAICAYAFLFPEDPEETPHPLDPRLRWAADLYNRSLARAFRVRGSETVLPAEGGVYRFPFGEIEVAVEPGGFRWGSRRIAETVDASEFEVRGLRNRYRRPGIGAPLAATAIREESEEDLASARLSERARVPVTLFLRIESPRRGLEEGRLHGRLELHSEFAVSTVNVSGHDVPLEVETTLALAYALQGSRLWEWELAGFRSSDLLPEFLRGLDDGLFMLEPYDPGRIPVVLVHGTASSPARWAELVNELESYPEIRERYQIWVFLYATGNPILYSAHLLRDALLQAVEQLDPEGRDVALRRMVVIGHSQGGLLAKALVTAPGNAFWEGSFSDAPFDEVAAELDPKTVELLGATIFFEPLAFVERVVFIATPHGGSFLARGRLGSFAGGLVRLPGDLVRAGVELVERDPAMKLRRRLDRLPSSVDNMNPGHTFTKTFSAIPVDERVQAHSIIAVLGDGPPQEGDDGVVEYHSAHIEEAVSELVVRSGHSVQGHPRTILEVRRILLEHLAAP